MIQAIDLDTVEMMEIESPTDPTRRLKVAFPISSATGTAASASVYFELEPGTHVGVHTDTAEEFLIVLEGRGEGLVGEETAPVQAGQVVVVPAMVRHDMTNREREVGERPEQAAGVGRHAGRRQAVRNRRVGVHPVVGEGGRDRLRIAGVPGGEVAPGDILGRHGGALLSSAPGRRGPRRAYVRAARSRHGCPPR